MSIGKLLLTLVLLFMFAFSEVLTAKISFAESHAKVTERNPFRSLLPTNTTATSLAQTLSKSASTKKNSSVQKKKVLKKTVVAKVVSQLPEIKPAVETDISSREKQLAKILKLKDILETSEGRYAFIDEKKCLISCRKESGSILFLSGKSTKIVWNCRKSTEKQPLF